MLYLLHVGDATWVGVLWRLGKNVRQFCNSWRVVTLLTRTTKPTGTAPSVSACRHPPQSQCKRWTKFDLDLWLFDLRVSAPLVRPCLLSLLSIAPAISNWSRLKTRGQSNLAKGPGCHWLTAECRVQTVCAATGSNRDYNSLAIAPKIVMLMSDDSHLIH